MANRRQSTALSNLGASGANSRASLGAPRLAAHKSAKTPGRASASGRKSLLGRPSVGGRRSMLPAKSPLLKPRSSSIYSGRGSSAFLDGPKKDTRPIKDKQWQAEQGEALIEFLIATNYNHHISPKILMQPTRKDFECIFQFLYRLIDPHMEFSNKFEDDVILIFKRLRYPFEVKKSALHAVGSPQYWPSLLAALSWLLETIKYSMAVEHDSESIDFTSSEDPTQDDVAEKLTYQYLQGAYKSFLAGEDEQEVDEFFGPHYEEKQRLLDEEIVRLTTEKTQMEARMSTLESGESLLSGISKKRDDFIGDVDKFHKFIGQLTDRKASLEQTKMALEQEEATFIAELKHLEAQKAQLVQQISGQTVSAVDVQNMNIEREKKREALRAAEASVESTTNEIYEAERRVTTHVETISELVASFNKRGSEIRVIPANAKYAGGLDLQLRSVPAGSEDEGNVNLDLKAFLKPALKKLKEAHNAKCHQAQEDLITLKDQANQAVDRVSDKQAALDDMKNTIAKIEGEAETAKAEEEKLEALQGDRVSVEADISRIKAEHEDQVSSLQKEIDEAKANHEQLRLKCGTEQQEMEAKVRATLDMVTDHKMYIHNSLRQIERHTTTIKQQIESSLS
eukprot:TRINITY_DN54319_c0_g1_i1.p1 TRINITY_DN54319_c0_g1~~TRINITY_DN54319_c0_g1_i1.p1  ORF type:complete len:624 (-),score=232.53 TRINITY_DN54319_c0_g1_i1:185-2056(-)